MIFDNLVRISKMKRVRGLPRLKKLDNVMCKQCQLGKMTNSSFKRKTYLANDILELVHTNLLDLLVLKDTIETNILLYFLMGILE